MTLIETFPRPGGIFWGRITPELLKPLGQWSDVVLNDSQQNGPAEGGIVPDPAGELKRLGVPRVWMSINALGVFVDAKGKPSVYWPQQRHLYNAATETNGWMRDGTGAPVIESAPWGRVALFDMSNRMFANRFAEEMLAALPLFSDVHGLFLDEAHSDIRDIRARHPGVTITNEAWTDGLRYALRRYASLMGGRPKPVITNGTFGRQHSSIVSGRFWQAATIHDVEKILDDAEGAAFTMVHSCTGLLTPDQLAVLAGAVPSGEACWQWTIHNGAFDAANVFPGTAEVTA